MTAIAIFLLLTALLGVASARGWTRDSRDPEYSVGRLIDTRSDAGGPGAQ